MGLACSNIRLLTLTARKADCEYGITSNTMQKMALTRDQSNLSKEYYSRLQGKRVAYYDKGEYRDINYNYLMGSGAMTEILSSKVPIKEDNSMILADYNGRVVLNDTYAKAIVSVLGAGAMGQDGRGGTFSYDKIPAILSKIIHGQDEQTIADIINNKTIPSMMEADHIQTVSGEKTGETSLEDISDKATQNLQKLVDFYYPIFASAAANGWTAEYNKDMKTNDSYVSDAITSGSFQLTKVNDKGNYEPDTPLTYFAVAGLVETKIDSEAREEITAWYNAEKERISEKESLIDINIQDLSTELEAINAEIKSVQSLIEDATNVFDWGGKG